MSRAYGCWTGLSNAEREKCFDPTSSRRGYLQQQSSYKAWRASGELAQEWNDLIVELKTRTDTDDFRRSLSSGKQSLPVVNFALYLAARRPDVAKLKPTIVAECRDVEVAKKACKALQQMKHYTLAPLLGSYEIDYAQSTIRLRADSDSDSDTPVEKKNLCGAQILILNIQPGGLTDPKSCTTATVGGVVTVSGKNYAMTAAHAFFRNSTDIDSDTSTNRTSNASIPGSGTSNSGSANSVLSRAGVAIVQSKVYAEKCDPIWIDENGSATLVEEPVKRALINTIEPNVLVNRDEDWALVPINNSMYDTINRLPINIGQGQQVTAISNTMPAGMVNVITGVSSPAEATMLSAASLLLLPGSKKSTIVWCAFGRSAPGDCGSWIVTPDGRAAAMVVAGSDDNEIFCLPLSSILQSIQQSLGVRDMPSLPVSKSAVPQRHEKKVHVQIESDPERTENERSRAGSVVIRDRPTVLPGPSTENMPIVQPDVSPLPKRTQTVPIQPQPSYAEYEESITSDSANAHDSPIPARRPRLRSRERSRVQIVDNHYPAPPRRVDRHVHYEDSQDNGGLKDKRQALGDIVVHRHQTPLVSRPRTSDNEAFLTSNVVVPQQPERYRIEPRSRSSTTTHVPIRNNSVPEIYGDPIPAMVYRSDDDESFYEETNYVPRKRWNDREVGDLRRRELQVAEKEARIHLLEEQQRRNELTTSTYSHANLPYAAYPTPYQPPTWPYRPRPQITNYAEEYPGQVDLGAILKQRSKASNGRTKVSHRDIHPEILNTLGIEWWTDLYESYYIHIPDDLSEKTLLDLRIRTQLYYENPKRLARDEMLAQQKLRQAEASHGTRRDDLAAPANIRGLARVESMGNKTKKSSQSSGKAKESTHTKSKQYKDFAKLDQDEDLRFEKVVNDLLQKAGVAGGTSEEILRLHRTKEARVKKHIKRTQSQKPPSVQTQQDAKTARNPPRDTGKQYYPEKVATTIDRVSENSSDGYKDEFAWIPSPPLSPASTYSTLDVQEDSSSLRQTAYRSPPIHYVPPFTSMEPAKTHYSPMKDYAPPVSVYPPRYVDRQQSWTEPYPPYDPSRYPPHMALPPPSAYYPPQTIPPSHLNGRREDSSYELWMAERDLARREAELRQEEARRAGASIGSTGIGENDGRYRRSDSRERYSFQPRSTRRYTEAYYG